MPHHAEPSASVPRSRSAAERARPTAATVQRVAIADRRPATAQLAQLSALANPPAAAPDRTGLPAALKAGVESLSGQSLDHVRVHRNSAKPAQLNAHAYAQGSDIHLAPGQEKHLPHEAWHVVQQAQGRVKPTLQAKGIAINDDRGLEHEAEANGSKALAIGPRVVREAVQRMSRGTDGFHPSARPRAVTHGPRRDNPVQRYLIIGNHDYTDDVNVQGQALGVVTAGVLHQINLAMGPPAFPLGSLENTMHVFLQADAGGVVTRQLSKWIEDQQGQAGPNSHPEFGRKHQARVYNNYVDLGRALYGWVNAKAGRREEKHLANQVYASPIIDAHINSVLARLKLFIDGHLNSAAMIVALSANNPAPALAPWADYRNWFNHTQPGLVPPIPGNYYAVLANPAAHNLRAKIAVLHDIMNYLVFHPVVAHPAPVAGVWPALPATTATGLAGRAAYARPDSSVLRRDPVAHIPIPNVAAARAAVPAVVRSSNEEQHTTYAYARTHNIPMWGRHSYTAARMMHLTQHVGGTQAETHAVADSIMAFWRKDYDHRSIAYHTLHEVQDFTPDFGLGAYNPLTRYDDMHTRIDVLPALMARLGVIAASANWNNRGWQMCGPNVTPTSIVAIRAELATGHTDVVKLATIQAEIHNKVGLSLVRNTITKNFYIILNRIPANVNLYTVGATARPIRSAIAIQLSRVLRELNAFNP